jgi:NAD+ synthase (glutamine-hydrolysing)
LPEEEIAFGPSSWLWDYLRRSRTGGFFLPLSGGADSSAVATIVHVMCHRVVDEIQRGNEATLRDLRAITGDQQFTPTKSQEVAGRIFYTSCAVPMATPCCRLLLTAHPTQTWRRATPPSRRGRAPRV